MDRQLGDALYHWRARRRLEISREQMEQRINAAIEAMVELEAHVPHLVHLLKWDDEFEKLVSNLPELSEPPEDMLSPPSGHAPDQSDLDRPVRFVGDHLPFAQVTCR